MLGSTKYFSLLFLILSTVVFMAGLTENCAANYAQTHEQPVLHDFSRKNRLPNIVVLATGGTIAGTAADVTQTTGYNPSVLLVQTLIESVPGVADIANISGEQFSQIASENMTMETYLALAKRVNTLLAFDTVDGIVITHGTDTLEETAYFLNLTVKSEKPVVLVGAMRPATAISADGPLNLYNAVTVAGAKNASGRGVMVCMSERILGARDAEKCHTFQTDAFEAGDMGLLGYVQGGRVEFYYRSEKLHTTQAEFDVSKLDSLPRVEIVYAYAGADAHILKNILQTKPDGLVFAATGNGSFSTPMRRQVLALDGSLPIVRSSRTGNGLVARNGEVNDDEYKTAAANNLSPQKARILLTLALTVSKNIEDIQRIMDLY